MPCYRFHLEGGGHGFICGDLGPHCSDANCGDVSGYLCDFPVSDGKTCDSPLCGGHAFEAAPTFHEVRALGGRLYEKAGWSKKEIQALMGHADEEMTEHYLEGHTGRRTITRTR